MKLTQNQLILEHLKEHKTINPIQALELFGCFRLGARIYNLKAGVLETDKRLNGGQEVL